MSWPFIRLSEDERARLVAAGLITLPLPPKAAPARVRNEGQKTSAMCSHHHCRRLHLPGKKLCQHHTTLRLARWARWESKHK